MLKSKYIYLAPLKDENAKLLYEWINDRNLVLLNTAYKPVSENQHLKWFDSIRQRSDAYILGIFLNKTKELIGYCQLRPIHYIYKHAELLIRIGKTSKQNKGYGSEAIKRLLKFSFNDLNLKRIYLHVFTTNKRAIKVYGNIGFKKEGTLRKHAHVDGKYVDVIIMGILRDEYEKT